jgi:hypothetical protein
VGRGRGTPVPEPGALTEGAPEVGTGPEGMGVDATLSGVPAEGAGIAEELAGWQTRIGALDPVPPVGTAGAAPVTEPEALTGGASAGTEPEGMSDNVVLFGVPETAEGSTGWQT